MSRSAHHSYVRSSSFQVPIRDGLTLIVLGRNGSASMSDTPWIGASHVIRSRYGRSASSAAATVRSGSSSHASGNVSATRR